MAAPRVETGKQLSSLLRSTADRLDQEDYGGLTGVVLVVEGAPGVFVNGPIASGTWVSMQGGEHLPEGLLDSISDVNILRRAKKGKVQ